MAGRNGVAKPMSRMVKRHRGEEPRSPGRPTTSNRAHTYGHSMVGVFKHTSSIGVKASILRSRSQFRQIYEHWPAAWVHAAFPSIGQPRERTCRSSRQDGRGWCQCLADHGPRVVESSKVSFKKGCSIGVASILYLTVGVGKKQSTPIAFITTTEVKSHCSRPQEVVIA